MRCASGLLAVFFAVVAGCSSADPRPPAGDGASGNGGASGTPGQSGSGSGESGAGGLNAGDSGSDGGTDGGEPDAEIDSGNDAEIAPGSDAMVGPDAGNDPETDAMVSTDATVEPECPGSGPGVKCEGNKRFACVEGQWAEQETCEHVCVAGSCSGVCEPGDRDCQGDVPRQCNAQGQWVDEPACPFLCSAGNCTGVCEPNDRDCSGLVPRECNTQGQWVAETACPYVCSGEGVCSGSCSPGAKSCSGDVPRTCNSAGIWTNEPECPFVCSAGACIGVCEPGDRDCSGLTPRQCNAQGQWVSETPCPFVCGGEGVCSGSCSPGAGSCTGDVPRTCNSAGQWVSGTECPFVCSAGSCIGVCEPGDTKCSGSQIQTCGSNGQWGSASSCPAVAGATSFCSASACTFDCNLDFDDCDGNPANGCEVNLNTNANHCGQCGHSCCGGACGSGTCQEADLGSPGNGYAVDANNIYTYVTTWHGVNASNTFEITKRPRLGGDTTTLASGQGKAWAIATDGTRVFWSGRDEPAVSSGAFAGTYTGGVYGAPIGGGTKVAYGNAYGFTADHLFMNLIADTNRLYWVEGLTTIHSRAHAETPNPAWTTTVSYTDAGDTNGQAKGVNSYVSDGQYLYISHTNSRRPIVRVPVQGGAATEFVSYTPPNPQHTWSLKSAVTDGVNLYYILFPDIGTPSMRGVWKKPLNGDAATHLYTSSTALGTNLATDGTYVYFTEYVSTGSIGPTNFPELWRVPVGGGARVKLSSVIQTTSSIRTASECVYWNYGGALRAIASEP